jgi:peptide/nickel transport system substrate-binding protein
MTHEIDRRTVLRAGGGLVAGLVAAGIAGCSSSGGDKKGGTSSGPGDSPANSPQPGGSSAPATGKRGGTLRYAVAAGVAGNSPDPAKALSTLPLAVAANCYDTLTRADQDYNLSPGLSTEWSGSPDAKTWTFKLRPGVTFHDGSKLTSKDVAYSFTRILDPKLAASALATVSPFVTKSGISTPDAQTVKFELEKPNAFFPVIISAISMGIVKDGETDFSKGNGTGPFSLSAFDSLTKVNLKRFDDYWENGLPYLDAVNYVVIPEDATRLQALTAGNQDVADNITGASTLLLKGNVQPYMIKTGGWVGLTMFGDTAPFNDPKIIQAMQYAADRKKIMSVVAPGIDVVSPDMPIPPSDKFYPAGLEPREYDPDKAKSLLKSAGHDSFSFDCWAYQGDKLDTVVSYKSTAEAAGIKVNVQNVPHDSFFSDDFLKKPAIGISVARLHISQAQPRLYSKGGDLNLTHFQNDQVDQLVQAAVSTTDEATQKKNFGDALQIINDSAANVIPGWEGQVYGVSNKITGMEATNGGQVFQTRTSFV